SSDTRTMVTSVSSGNPSSLRTVSAIWRSSTVSTSSACSLARRAPTLRPSTSSECGAPGPGRCYCGGRASASGQVRVGDPLMVATDQRVEEGSLDLGQLPEGQRRLGELAVLDLLLDYPLHHLLDGVGSRLLGLEHGPAC